MPEQSFEELLKSRLSGINAAFQQADADLHRAVANAAVAVGSITDGAATLQLFVEHEGVQGVTYGLYLNSKGHRHLICGFGVQVAGYPILQAVQPFPTLLVDDSKAATKLGTASDLESFFADMAKNPDSPLVRHLAFILRKKAS